MENWEFRAVCRIDDVQRYVVHMYMEQAQKAADAKAKRAAEKPKKR